MAINNLYVSGMALSQFIFGAKHLGIDSMQIIAKAGLSQEHLSPKARVPESKYEMALLRLISAHKGNTFGFDIGQQVMPSLYGVLMTLALNSSTLGEAFKLLAKYQSIATGNCGEVEYSLKDQHYILTIAMTHQNPLIRRHVSECVMVHYCNLAKIVTANPHLAPIEVGFAHSLPSESDRRHIESTLNCKVKFNQHESYMVLGKHHHQSPILGHDEVLLRISDKHAQSLLEQTNKKLSEIEKIKWHILELMQSSSPRREIVAKRLQISTRTLDRRLEQADTSWQKLIDELRLQLALEHLKEGKLMINDIALTLGFTEIRAFQRKFKYWTGLTPSEYRKNASLK